MGKVILTVKFFFGNKKAKSKVISSTVDPVWNYTITLPKGTLNTNLIVEVWDHDNFIDDFLGYVDLSNLDLTKESCAEHLLKIRNKKDKGIKGSIEIKVEL